MLQLLQLLSFAFSWSNSSNVYFMPGTGRAQAQYKDVPLCNGTIYNGKHWGWLYSQDCITGATTGVHREPVGQNKSRLILHGREAVLSLEGCIPGDKEGETTWGGGGGNAHKENKNTLVLSYALPPSVIIRGIGISNNHGVETSRGLRHSLEWYTCLQHSSWDIVSFLHQSSKLRRYLSAPALSWRWSVLLGEGLNNGKDLGRQTKFWSYRLGFARQWSQQQNMYKVPNLLIKWGSGFGKQTILCLIIFSQLVQFYL